MRRAMERSLYAAYVVVFFLYLLAPLAVVVAFAFNAGRYPAFPFTGFTLRWFGELFRDAHLLDSMGGSLTVAAAVTPASTVIAFLTALALARRDFFGKRAFYLATLTPIVTPGIILGLSLLLLITRLGLRAGLWAVGLGHCAFLSSYLLLIFLARLKKFDLTLEEAAMDLGATRRQALFKVTIPYMRPALLAGAGLAFLVSFNNFNTSLFLVGNDRTLPIHIFSMLRFGLSPKVNAVSVVLIAASVVAILITRQIRQWRIGT